MYLAKLATQKYVKGIPIGHLIPDISLEDAKQKLAQVKGHLVEMPLGFLEDQKDAFPWNKGDLTLPIYI